MPTMLPTWPIWRFGSNEIYLDICACPAIRLVAPYRMDGNSVVDYLDPMYGWGPRNLEPKYMSLRVPSRPSWSAIQLSS